MDIAATLHRGLDFFGDAVGALDAQTWGNPTPCAGWTARDLVGHVIGVMQIAIQVTRGGELRGSLAPVPLDADPAETWRRVAAEVRDAVATADLDAPRDTSLGRHPTSFALTFPALDLFPHAWDLGRAAGRDVQLPDDIVGWIDGFLGQLPPDRLRGPGVFAPEQPAPDGADATTRLMAFTGRAVSP